MDKEMLKLLRKQKGLTQKQLGERCNIAESTIRRYENGGLRPKLETIKRIAVALEVPYGDLLNDRDSKGFFMIDFSNGLEKEPISAYISKEEIAAYKNGSKEFSDEWIKMYNSFKKHNLNVLFDKLNEMGQEKALDQVELLTKIEEFTK